MGYRIRFHRSAKQDLNEIYQHIAQDNPARAIAFVGRLRQQCASLKTMPYRGSPRDDLQPGIRILVFERRTTIAYRIREDAVQILRIFYAGRDFRSSDIEADET